MARKKKYFLFFGTQDIRKRPSSENLNVERNPFCYNGNRNRYKT